MISSHSLHHLYTYLSTAAIQSIHSVHVHGHVLSSQGWAPECPTHLCFTGVVCWVWVSFLSSFPLQLPQLHVHVYIYFAMHMCFYVYIHVHVITDSIVYLVSSDRAA